MIINYNHGNRGGVMLTKLSQIIVDFFVKEDVVSEEQREIYQYGIELSVSTLIGLFIVLQEVFSKTKRSSNFSLTSTTIPADDYFARVTYSSGSINNGTLTFSKK